MELELCQERIRELLNRSGGVAAELFAAARTGAEVPGGSRSSVQCTLLVVSPAHNDLIMNHEIP